MWHILEEGQITNIAVRSDVRGRGVGNVLLAKMLASAREKEWKGSPCCGCPTSSGFASPAPCSRVVMACDLALTATQRLRGIGVSGEFVEYFGPGVSTLTAGERAVVSNMARNTAPPPAFSRWTRTRWTTCAAPAAVHRIALVETYSRRAGFWFDPRGPSRATPGSSLSTFPPSACISPGRAGHRT